MLRTPFCSALGIEHPIVCAPMGFVTGPGLAAAVSNAGGLGIMAGGGLPPQILREQVHELKSLTSKPYGVNLFVSGPRRAAAHFEGSLAVCLEERVPLISFYAGDPSRYVDRVHAAGLKCVEQVGSVKSARRAAAAGMDAVIAQGYEAGGHVDGRVGTLALVPRVVDAISPTPVLAAGGIADGRGVAAVLALGAQAAVLGTRFIATPEAGAHPSYKQRLVGASEEDTVFTILFGNGWPNAPHRVLRTPFVQEWLLHEARGSEEQPNEPQIAETRVAGLAIPIPRFSSIPPGAATSGDLESMAHYAGEGVGLVQRIQPAGEIVRELVAGAEAALKKLG